MCPWQQDRIHGDILYPAWSFWEGGPAIALHPTGLGRWDIRRKTLIGAANRHKWSKKKELAFFRLVLEHYSIKYAHNNV